VAESEAVAEFQAFYRVTVVAVHFTDQTPFLSPNQQCQSTER